MSSRSLFVVCAVGVSAPACVDMQTRQHETTSLEVTVTSPTSFGTADNRLPDNQRTVGMTVRALDEMDALDTDFAASIDISTFWLGTLTPLGQKLLINAGQGSINLNIGTTYGPTYLWLEDASDTSNGRTPTWATGTSPQFWYRDPFIADVETPDMSDPYNWLAHSPLEGKQVKITGSKSGAAGMLVVTGIYSAGYTLTDVPCAGCAAAPFSHVFVYTYGLPRDDNGTAIVAGHVMKWVSGGSGEFNGFTELNFPQGLIDDTRPASMANLPPPVVLDKAWLKNYSAAGGMIKLEEQESGLVEVDNGTICPMDGDWTKYGQWKLDVGWGCGTPINVVTAGQLAFDPTTKVGTKLAKVVGTVKAVNIGSFNVWILLPRFAADITP